MILSLLAAVTLGLTIEVNAQTTQPTPDQVGHVVIEKNANNWLYRVDYPENRPEVHLFVSQDLTNWIDRGAMEFADNQGGIWHTVTFLASELRTNDQAIYFRLAVPAPVTTPAAP